MPCLCLSLSLAAFVDAFLLFTHNSAHSLQPPNLGFDEPRSIRFSAEVPAFKMFHHSVRFRRRFPDGLLYRNLVLFGLPSRVSQAFWRENNPPPPPLLRLWVSQYLVNCIGAKF